MPIVPTVTGRQVESRGVQSPGFQAFSSPNAGDVAVSVGGAALHVLGQAKQQADLALTQEATLKLSAVGNDLKSNPETGFLTLEGKNALGKAPEYIQQFDAQVANMAEDLPESSRPAFLRLAQQQRTQFATQAEMHELGQRRQFESGQQKGYEQLQMQQAVSNPAQFNESSLNAFNSIRAFGQAHGQSAEEVEANWQSWREQTANRASDAWYNPMYQQMMGPDGKIQVTNTPRESQLFSAMIWHESGGNQFGADGQPLVSPKGAVGVSQLTESTGLEAARLAGLSWDRDKWLHDPRYNAQLGQAYFNAQMDRYDNNPVLAVAAYNAGPGAVERWIKQIGDPRSGHISNAQFATAIPYEETRDYVAKVTGSAGGIPGNATMESLISQPFWHAMSPQKKSQMMSKVAGLYDMQSAAGRVALQSKMQDDLAKVESGQPVNPITAHEWAAVMPLQASPAERMQLEKTYHQYQQAMTLQPVYQTIMQGTPRQGAAAVQAIMPQESDADFKFKQGLYATAQAKLNSVLKARESDPGAWLQMHSPVAQNAFEQYQNGKASGEYLVSRLEAEKSRLGILSKKVLPDNMADTMAAQLDSGNAKFTDVQHLFSGFGAYANSVIAQVQSKASAPVSVAMGVNNINAANSIFSLRNTPTDDLRKNAGAQANSVDTNWNSSVADIAPTFALQANGGAETLSHINDQGKRLAYQYVSQGVDAETAAKKAYQQILGDHYVVHDTWRMPNSLNLNENTVSDGLKHAVNSLKPGDVINPNARYDSALTPEMNAANTLAQIKNNAEWVTNSDETGVYLTANGNYIYGKDGNPIGMSFVDASKTGIVHPGFVSSIESWSKEKRKVTPADQIIAPNINATMDDAYRIVRGEGVRDVSAQQESPSVNSLREALNRKGGQQ